MEKFVDSQIAVARFHIAQAVPDKHSNLSNSKGFLVTMFLIAELFFSSAEGIPYPLSPFSQGILSKIKAHTEKFLHNEGILEPSQLRHEGPRGKVAAPAV